MLCNQGVIDFSPIVGKCPRIFLLANIGMKSFTALADALLKTENNYTNLV